MIDRPKDGETWTSTHDGRVYRWSEKLSKWVWTGMIIPVPCLGEFP